MEKTKDKNVVERSQNRICLYCGGQYSDQDVDIHMHSFVHHEAIDRLKQRKHKPTCLACNVAVTGMKPYKDHIGTPKHARNLYKLHKQTNKSHRKMYNITLTTSETLALQRAGHNNKNLMETCFVCGQIFPVQNVDEHMHSTFHHQTVEQLKGSPQVHTCLACAKSETGMKKYNQHLRTDEHKFNLFVLQKDRVDGNKVDYYAENDDELRRLCDRRGQMKKTKKAARKTREKQKTKNLNDKNTNKHALQPVPVMADIPFTNDHLPPSCHLSSHLSWHHQNDHSAFVKPVQNLSKRRQDAFDMSRSNEPLAKRPCFETPAVICPQKVASPDTLSNHEEVEVWVNGLLSQSRTEASKQNLTTAAEGNIGNKAVVLRDSLQKQSHSNESAWKFSRTASQSEQGTSVGINRQVFINSLQSVTSLAETFKSQTSKFDLQDFSHNPNPVTNKNSSVNKLLKLSSKEEELSRSLNHVGEQLIQMYSTLESARSEVQRLLAVKQQFTLEMSSLREKRLKILQDMKDTSECPSNPDQQVALNVF